MHRDLKSAVARLKVGSSKRGTAFLVHRDPPTVLTALHIVADRRDPASFELSARRYGRDAALRFGDPDDGGTWETTAALDDASVRALPALDLCLIRLAEAPPARPLPTFGGALSLAGERFETFGFPDAAPERGLAIGGDFADLGRGQVYAREAAAGQGLAVAGLSGAPCVVRGTAVGVFVESQGPKEANVGGALFVRDASPLRATFPDAFAWWGPAPALAVERLLPAQFEALAALLDLAPASLLPPAAPPEARAAELLRRVADAPPDRLRDALRRVGGIPS